LICLSLLSLYLFIHDVSSFPTRRSSDLKSLQKILMLPTSLFVAYVLTIFVNTSRIFASILVQSQTKSVFFNHQHIIHEAIGITTDRKSTRLNSSHVKISYAVFCLKKKIK